MAFSIPDRWNPIKQLQAGWELLTNPPKPSVQLTPYAQQRLAEQKQQITPTAASTYRPPTPTKTTSSYSYSGSGGGSIPSYSSAFSQGQQAAKNVYDPYRSFIEKQTKETPKRYDTYASKAKERIPLIQQRYQALLDQINQNFANEQTTVGQKETEALGRNAARAAARGTYGSSTMEGGDQLITKEALSALRDIAERQRAKGQELSAAEGGEIQDVYDYMNSLRLQGEDATQNLIGTLLGLAPQEFSAANQYAGNVVDTETARTQAALSALKASESGSGAGTYKEFVDENGTPQIGYFVGGQLQNVIGGSIPGSERERAAPALSKAIQSVQSDNVVTPEELQLLKAQFPYDTDTINQIVQVTQQPNFFQKLLGMF